MSNRQKQKRHIGVTAVIVIILLIVLACLVIAWKTGMLTIKRNGIDKYYYSSDENSDYTTVGGGIAVISSDSMQVYRSDGTQTLNEKFIMESPAVCAGGQNALCYDIGGTAAKLFNKEKIVQSLNPDGNIISASMNDKGMACICCEESGYRGAVMVYDSYGTLVFKWMSGSGYVLNAAVSQDGGKLCVNTLTESGTNAVFLDLKDDEYSKACALDGEMLIDLAWGSDGTVRAISTTGLYELRAGKEAKLIYPFDEKHMDGYDLGTNTIIVLKEFKSGGNCDIIRTDEYGESQTVASFEDGITSVSSTDANIAVLSDGALDIYNTRTCELKSHYDTQNYTKVFMRKDATAVCAARHSADVFEARADERSK